MHLFKKRQMTLIWKDILSLMKSYGFHNASYTGYPAERWHFYRAKKPALPRKLFDYHNRPFSSGLSATPSELAQGYFKEHLDSDPLVIRILKEPVGTLVSSAMFRGQKDYEAVDDFFHQWNAGSRIAIALPSLTEHWFPVLSASGNLTRQEEHKVLHQASDSLVRQLTAYNMELVFHYGDYFNPFIAYQTFSAQAREILQLISAGFTNKEAAEKTGLTQDGIKYHLKSMRVALGANNIAQLIAISKELKII